MSGKAWGRGLQRWSSWRLKNLQRSVDESSKSRIVDVSRSKVRWKAVAGSLGTVGGE